MMLSSTEPARSGFKTIVLATLVAGAAGYVITAIIARGLGDEEYALFALFWAALYLLIGALSGIQQEISRSSRPDGSGANSFVLASMLAAVVLVVAGVSIPVWAPVALLGRTELGWPVAAGAACYVFVAVLSGQMYGLGLWRPLAVVIVLDVLLRLLAVTLGLLGGAGATLMAWLTVLPFPLVSLVALLLARRRLSGRLDVGYRQSLANIARTILAASATAVLVSGFPLLIGITSGDADTTTLSTLIFALILTRAPLVVSTLALQSYLVVHFRDRVDAGRHVLSYSAAVVALALLLATVVALWGQPVLAAVTGWGDFQLGGGVLAMLVLSSAPTAVLAISGAAVLARSNHTSYAAGWLAAAAAAGAIMFLPGEVLWRTLLALSVGPLVGIIAHLGSIVRRTQVP